MPTLQEEGVRVEQRGEQGERLESLQRNIFYRHFDLPANFPVIGLLGDSWKMEFAPPTRAHFHNCMEIGFLYTGSGRVYIGNREIRFQAPCLVVMPPNVPHVHSADEGQVCGWKWLYVDPQTMLPQLSPRLSSKISEYQRSLGGEDCVLSAKDHPKVYALTEMIIEEMENTRTHYHHVVRELFYALSLMLLRTCSGTARSDQYVNAQLGCISPAIAYIAENYMEEIQIDKLSQLCHVSTSHFRRLFKQVLGWAPLDYVQMVRIDRACVLLYDCDLSVTEIGMQVGYPSPSSFNRQFRKIHGISPSQWRQKVRSEENPIVTAYFNSLPPTTLQFFPQEYYFQA